MTLEPVVFRHWDPNVLSVVIPTLTASQTQRVFCDGSRIIIADDDPWSGSLIFGEASVLPGGLSARTPLRFSPEQMRAITHAMNERALRSIVHDLVKIVTWDGDPVPEDVLLDAVRAADKVCDANHLRDRASLLAMSTLVMGDSAENAILGHLAAATRDSRWGRSPDERLLSYISTVLLPQA